MTFDRYARSIPDLLGDVVTQTTTLLRQESRLARAEVSEKVGQATGAVAFLLIGAVLMIPALVILLDAAVLALVENNWSPTLAALIIGGIALALGVVLMLVGKSRLSPSNLAPTRTVHQLQRDAATAQDHLRANHHVRTDHVHAHRAA